MIIPLSVINSVTGPYFPECISTITWDSVASVNNDTYVPTRHSLTIELV